MTETDNQLAECIARRIRVALGREPGDLLITGGQVINVFNRRVEPGDVVIADGRITGTNAADMLICAKVLAEHGGGFVVVAEGDVRAVVPLPVAGLLSRESALTVCRQLDEANRAARALGCPLGAPFGTLSFLALPVIPELRITTRGIFDVTKQKFVTL